MESVGIVIISRKTNRMLLLHRASKPIVWSTLTGKMEKGETPLQTIKREIKEEIGLDSSLIDNIEELDKTKSNHHVMVGYVEDEFKIPNLKKDENDAYGWFSKEELPSPLHSKWNETFQLIEPLLNLREGFKYYLNKISR
jgi:8-oxo-dGTP pyrophosphatase MutT (NUDIX family)